MTRAEIHRREARRMGRQFIAIALLRAAQWRGMGDAEYCRDMIYNAKTHRFFAAQHGSHIP